MRVNYRRSWNRNAANERRIEEAREAGIEPRYAPLPREPARLVFSVDWQTFEAIGTPCRKCHQYAWALNGESVGVGGAEFIWREIQKRRAMPLGTRNLQ